MSYFFSLRIDKNKRRMRLKSTKYFFLLRKTKTKNVRIKSKYNIQTNNSKK